MKKIFSILFMSAFLFTACSTDGDRGPQGPQGPEGPPGDGGLVGTALEFEGINLNEDNDYSFYVDFDDQGIEVLESDVVLVYLKDGEAGTAGDDNLPVEIFRPLPQTYYVDSGEIQYNYEFTFFETWFFMEGTADFNALDDNFTQNQVIRIVVVPAGFAENTKVNISSYNAVMNALDLKETDIKKMGTLKN